MRHSVDIDSMTPRELCALVAAERNSLSEEATRRLFRYAFGFAEGLVHAMHNSDPNNSEGPEACRSLADDQDYVDGRLDGITENGFMLYPSNIEGWGG
jgi:hypothetical protein